jgi:hypothetical protein|tara:strand:- start:1099 stop:1899 length:801 start_codon:yes stop_codon:yes gene_type:complete
MSSVKGSKQYQLEVVSYRPFYRWSMRLLAVCLVLGGIAGSYFFGLRQGTSLDLQALIERDNLRVDLADIMRSSGAYRQQLTDLELGSEIDRQANEDVRVKVIDLKAQVAGLEEEISFYKALMSPSGNKRGLTIGSVNIVASNTPRRYQYKLVLQQLATQHQLLKGYLNVHIVGRQAGQLVTLPMKDLNDELTDENIKLNFKYFQKFSGEMLLPEGFEPMSIALLAKSTGKNAVTVEEQFDWLVQNSRSNVVSTASMFNIIGSSDGQ